MLDNKKSKKRLLIFCRVSHFISVLFPLALNSMVSIEINGKMARAIKWAKMHCRDPYFFHILFCFPYFSTISCICMCHDFIMRKIIHKVVCIKKSHTLCSKKKTKNGENGKKKMGVGAVCQASVKFMHPSKLMRDKFINITAQLKIDGLLALRQELKLVSRKHQMCVVFRHDYWPNKEVHCCKRWATALNERDASKYFDRPLTLPNEDEDNGDTNPNLEDEGEDIEERFFQLSGTNAEDVAHVRSLGLGVDDDNQPAPENVPTDAPTEDTNQTWGWDGVDHRSKHNFFDVAPTLNHRLPELSRNSICGNALVHLFLTLFSKPFLENILLPATNKNLQDNEKVILGELLRSFGQWFF